MTCADRSPASLRRAAGIRAGCLRTSQKIEPRLEGSHGSTEQGQEGEGTETASFVVTFPRTAAGLSRKSTGPQSGRAPAPRHHAPLALTFEERVGPVGDAAPVGSIFQTPLCKLRGRQTCLFEGGHFTGRKGDKRHCSGLPETPGRGPGQAGVRGAGLDYPGRLPMAATSPSRVPSCTAGSTSERGRLKQKTTPSSLPAPASFPPRSFPREVHPG